MFTLHTLVMLSHSLAENDALHTNASRVNELLDSNVSDMHLIVSNCHTLRDAFKSDNAMFNHFDFETDTLDCVDSAIELITEQFHVDLNLVCQEKSIEELRDTYS